MQLAQETGGATLTVILSFFFLSFHFFSLFLRIVSDKWSGNNCWSREKWKVEREEESENNRGDKQHEEEEETCVK